MGLGSTIILIAALTGSSGPPERATLERFVDHAADFERELKLQVQREADDRRRLIRDAFERRRLTLVQRRGAAGADARDALERFLSRHPDDPRHTPPALLRLATLAADEGQTARSLELATRAARFEHADRPLALYLVGWSLLNLGRDAEALATFESLVSAHPASTAAPEAWLRIGEARFDAARWSDAALAYARAAAPGTQWYEMALYKLAWTRFMQGDRPASLEEFARLLALPAGSDLRSALQEEAVQFTARSLAEPDWDGDGLADASGGAARILAFGDTLPAKVRERVRVEAARSSFDLHEPAAYRVAARVWSAVIDARGNHADNLALRDRIVEAFELAGDEAEAQRQRRLLVATPGPTAADTHAAEIHARTQLRLAIGDHRTAQALRAEGKDGRAAYARAVAGYTAWLNVGHTSAPSTARTREVRYLRAEAMYFGGRFLPAAAEYAALRDSGDDEWASRSAPSAVAAAFEAVRAEVAAKTVPEGALGAQRGTPVATPLTAALTEWRDHVDALVRITATNSGGDAPADADRAGGDAIRVALMLHNLGHVADAVKRLDGLATHAGSELAPTAAELLVGIQLDRDVAAAEAFLAAVQSRLSPDVSRRLRAAIAQRRFVASFEAASAQLEAGAHLDSAATFEALLKSPGLTPATRQKTRFNAAVAWLRAKRHDRARPHFEVLARPGAPEATFRRAALEALAGSYATTMELAEATRRLESLVSAFPTAATPEVLRRAARIQRALGDVQRAATLFEQAGAPLEAAAAWGAAGRTARQRRVLRSALKRTDAPGTRVRLLAALGDATTRRAAAARRYADAIHAFETAGLKPGTPAAEAAARATFGRLERRYARFAEVRLVGSVTRQGRTLQRQLARLRALETAYEEVLAYKSLGWTVAATYRMGRLHEAIAHMLRDAPTPDLPSDPLGDYERELERVMTRFEDRALSYYEAALTGARGAGAWNTWADRTLEAANRLAPDRFARPGSERMAEPSLKEVQILPE